MKLQNIIRKCLFFIVTFSIPVLSHAQTIGLFYDSIVPQIKFAATDIKNALQSKGFTVEVLPLTSLSTSYSNKKVVISLASDASTNKVLNKQGGAGLPALGEQAYALRTTTTPQTTYWAIGGDENGAMYGGIQLSEHFTTNGFSGTYNNDEKPYMLNRGMKLNMPLDKNVPTYQGRWKSTSPRKAIPHVWDITFWKKLIDHQARNRYNVLSVWVHHPFPALVKLADYPKASLPGIEGFDGFTKALNHDQRVAYWREVMTYAHDRGMKFYFFNWNVFLDHASTYYPNLTDSADNTDTKDYMYKSMYALVETYPELDGFGISAGDGMIHQPGFNNDKNIKTQWTWDAMGKAVKDYLDANPTRTFELIHRGLATTPEIVDEKFSPLKSSSNAKLIFSIKYAHAHMYSTPTPTWQDHAVEGCKEKGLKTWLTVRNDDYFFLHWGDHQFVRDFMSAIPENQSVVTGMYIGSDNYSPTRTYFYKNSTLNGQLEVERRWYMEMLWGRISYNPKISNDVFKNMLAKRFPNVSTKKLFDAWTLASRPLPKVTELIMKKWHLDIHWYPEGCNGSTWFTPGFKTVYDFANLSKHPKARKTSVADGSSFCDIPNSAAGNCNGKKSSYTVADEMQADAEQALTLVADMNPAENVDLKMAISNIKQMAYLGLYYSCKVRGATYLSAEQTEKAKEEMGKAYCWWMSYSRAMDNDYYGDRFRTMAIMPDWKYADADVLKDYTDLGGIGEPNCKEQK
ncbi:hypothetical protein ACFL6U_03425 [Planctomycetota bacterium]